MLVKFSPLACLCLPAKSHKSIIRRWYQSLLSRLDAPSGVWPAADIGSYRSCMKHSVLDGSKESDKGFLIALCHENLSHAQWNLLHHIRRQPSAIAHDRRRPRKPIEARLAGVYRACERPASRHFGGVTRNRQSEMCVWCWQERFMHSVFHPVVDLQAAINRFVHKHNAHDPKPFIWKASPYDIISAQYRGF